MTMATRARPCTAGTATAKRRHAGSTASGFGNDGGGSAARSGGAGWRAGTGGAVGVVCVWGAGRLRQAPPTATPLEASATPDAGERLEPLDLLPVLLGQIALRQPLNCSEPRPLGHGIALVFAAEEPARQREIGQEAEAVGFYRRQQLALDVAGDEAVLVLAGDEGVEGAVARGPGRLDHLPRCVVGAADVAHLALAHEVVERAQRLLDRRQRVRAMHLVEVDPIGLEALQAPLHSAHDVAPRRALEPLLLVHGHAELGRQHDFLAPVAEDLPQGFLRAAEIAVDVGRIEQGDAELECLVDDLARRLEIDAPAEIVAAQADDGDREAGASERALLHGRVLWKRVQRGCGRRRSPSSPSPAPRERV